MTTEERYRRVRGHTEALAAPLSAEDQTVQSMPDVSPTKWHRAHTTWFFETFVLVPHLAGYTEFDPSYDYLFNSYYEAVGDRYPRARRGLVSRPGVDDVAAYRRHVDEAMGQLLAGPGTGALDGPLDGPLDTEVTDLVELGLHHEEQHQELLLMDLTHVLWQSPLRPAYVPDPVDATNTGSTPPGTPTWHDIAGGIVDVGHDGSGFAFDNEGPQHQVLVPSFRIADRLVTNEEWLEFVTDDGYRRADLWLSDGWASVQAENWQAPLYWEHRDGTWYQFGLHGSSPVDPSAPVVHVSHYEADAFARWAGCRLPTEFEWEHAVRSLAGPASADGTAAPRRLRCTSVPAGAGPLADWQGQVWQWTSSAYLPYPGFRPAPGAVGEYNGKFMSGQMVLRGGSVHTSAGHTRPTYRNFFPPAARWIGAGLRLAADA